VPCDGAIAISHQKILTLRRLHLAAIKNESRTHHPLISIRQRRRN
jgi:hypothetical protein